MKEVSTENRCMCCTWSKETLLQRNDEADNAVCLYRVDILFCRKHSESVLAAEMRSSFNSGCWHKSEQCETFRAIRLGSILSWNENKVNIGIQTDFWGVPTLPYPDACLRRRREWKIEQAWPFNFIGPRFKRENKGGTSFSILTSCL